MKVVGLFSTVPNCNLLIKVQAHHAQNNCIPPTYQSEFVIHTLIDAELQPLGFKKFAVTGAFVEGTDAWKKFVADTSHHNPIYQLSPTLNFTTHQESVADMEFVADVLPAHCIVSIFAATGVVPIQTLQVAFNDIIF